MLSPGAYGYCSLCSRLLIDGMRNCFFVCLSIAPRCYVHRSKGKVSLMFSLLHVHFEAVLRAVAETRPDFLKTLQRTFSSRHYHAASPAQRLYLLEGQIQQLAQSNQDLFTEEVFERVVQT